MKLLIPKFTGRDGMMCLDGHQSENYIRMLLAVRRYASQSRVFMDYYDAK